MPPEGLLRRARRGGIFPVPAEWRSPLLTVALVWVALIALFSRDWTAMAGQWWNSSTYTHILVVPFILAWLVQIRAPQLARLTPRTWWPGLIFCAAALVLWLLGTLAGMAAASQAGAVAILAATLITLLGPKIGAGLAFPLGYMAFLVPIGDELVPTLQIATAKLTIALVGLSGVPASVDGVFIDTPAGLFEVAEACSGVKFLVAMAAFGVLVGNVCFRDWSRRLAFVFLALALPILANGVRAWGTIYIAQFVGAEAATGFDHIVYGWIFFALVIAATLAMGWRFFDRAPEDPMIDAAALDRSRLLTRLERLALTPVAGVAAIAILALATFAWATAAGRLRAELPTQLALPQVAGWQLVGTGPEPSWEPRATGAELRLLARYRDADGREVDVFVALYSAQGEGREAGGFGEGAVRPGGQWAWLASGNASADAKIDRLLGPARRQRIAETRFRTGDLLTGSDLQLRLANLADRLRLRPRPTMMLILSAEEAAGASAADSLQAFRRSAGPLGDWMDRIAGLG